MVRLKECAVRHYDAITGGCLIAGIASAFGYDAFEGWAASLSVAFGVLAGMCAMATYFLALAGEVDRG